MIIRSARAGDAPAVQELYQALVPGDPNISVDPRRLAELEDDFDNHLLIAERTGQVCGTAFVTICLDPMYGFQPFAVLENLVVLASARRSGVGRALLQEAERIARAAQCTKLMLLSSAARTEAHEVFTRLGFDGQRKRGFVKYLNR
jgi:N-acetylglutamate synthase-like GNAT family acetyltransferase